MSFGTGESLFSYRNRNREIFVTKSDFLSVLLFPKSKVNHYEVIYKNTRKHDDRKHYGIQCTSVGYRDKYNFNFIRNLQRFPCTQSFSVKL